MLLLEVGQTVHTKTYPIHSNYRLINKEINKTETLTTPTGGHRWAKPHRQPLWNWQLLQLHEYFSETPDTPQKQYNRHPHTKQPITKTRQKTHGQPWHPWNMDHAAQTNLLQRQRPVKDFCNYVFPKSLKSRKNAFMIPGSQSCDLKALPLHHLV